MSTRIAFTWKGVTVTSPRMGRPIIGGEIRQEIGEVLKARVEQWAATNGITRAEAVRILLTQALDDELKRATGPVFVATVSTTGEKYRFRSLGALARRVGGTSYEIQPVCGDLDAPLDPDNLPRRVTIKKGSRRVAEVEVPSEALE